MAYFEGSIGTPSGGFNLKVEYSISQSISGNYSDVIAIGYVKRNKSSYHPYNSTSSANLNIGGNSASASPSYNLGSDGYKTIMSHSARIYHNSDGKKSITITFSFDGKLSSYYPNGSISQTITLPTIPRQANIKTAPDFNDEENPTITYENSAGNSVTTLQACISLTGSVDDIKYRDINKTGDLSYTFELTEEERNILRQATITSNNRTIYFYIRTIIDGVTYYSKIAKTFSIINADPIFNNFEFEDINEKTIALTGNNQSVILGYSNIKVTIPVANKAVAQKEATMSKYRFNSIDANYSDTEDISIVSNKVTSGDFTVYAIDSRGNSTPKTKNANKVIEYKPLVKDNIVVQRQNGVSENVILRFNGTWWNDVFGKIPTTGALRNIQVGDNLSGKKIYCTFNKEYQFYKYLEKEGNQTIITTDNSNSIESIIEEFDGYYETTVVANNDNLYYGSSQTNVENSLPTYTMPENYGVVTYINETAMAYGNIFIESENPTYEDVNNTIIARYRYSVAGEENYFYGETPIELIIDGENYSFEGLIAGDLESTGFDINNAYNIQVIVDDKLSQVVFTANLGSGTPHVAYAKNGVGIMGKYDESVGGLLQVGGQRIDNISGGGGDSLPIGAIVDYDGNNVPEGYVEVTDENVYSTEETLTGETWIDGKPIYRKVSILSNSFVKGENNFNTGISNMETLVDTELHFKYNDWWYKEWSENGLLNKIYKNNGAIFYVLSYDALTTQKNILITKYTKTTD